MGIVQCFGRKTTREAWRQSNVPIAVWQASSEAASSVSPTPWVSTSRPSPGAKLLGRRKVHLKTLAEPGVGPSGCTVNVLHSVTLAQAPAMDFWAGAGVVVEDGVP